MGLSYPQIFETGREKFQFNSAVTHSLVRAWRHPVADLARGMREASQPMSESGAIKKVTANCRDRAATTTRKAQSNRRDGTTPV